MLPARGGCSGESIISICQPFLPRSRSGAGARRVHSAEAMALCQTISTGLLKRSAGTLGSMSAGVCLGARHAAPLDSILFFPQLFEQGTQDLSRNQKQVWVWTISLPLRPNVFPIRMDFGLKKAHRGWKREASQKLCSDLGGWRGRDLGAIPLLGLGRAGGVTPSLGCWWTAGAPSAGAVHAA